MGHVISAFKSYRCGFHSLDMGDSCLLIYLLSSVIKIWFGVGLVSGFGLSNNYEIWRIHLALDSV